MILVAEADDDVDLDARLCEGLGLRVCDGAAHAAADDADALACRSTSVGVPSGPTKSWMIVALVPDVPSISVDRPTFWKMIVTVPFSRS